MSDVANEAQVGRATLYRYASSRDELVAALQRLSLERLATALEEVRGAAVPPGEELSRVIRATLGVRAEFAFVVDEPKHIDQDEIRGVLGPLFESFITRARESGTLRTDVSVEWQMYVLAALCRAAGKMTDPLADTAGMVLDAFVSGMGSPPSRQRSD
jgi:AcrR family transcriptional regulator